MWNNGYMGKKNKVHNIPTGPKKTLPEAALALLGIDPGNGGYTVKPGIHDEFIVETSRSTKLEFGVMSFASKETRDKVAEQLARLGIPTDGDPVIGSRSPIGETYQSVKPTTGGVRMTGGYSEELAWRGTSYTADNSRLTSADGYNFPDHHRVKVRGSKCRIYRGNDKTPVFTGPIDKIDPGLLVTLHLEHSQRLRGRRAEIEELGGYCLPEYLGGAWVDFKFED